MDQPLQARSAKLALDSLGGHPGWPLYCARFEEIRAKEIDAKIFDLATSDEDRRTLVSARKLLSESYAPEKMRTYMLTALKTEITRGDNATAPGRGSVTAI